MARSPEILGKFSLKLPKMGKNSLKIHKFSHFLGKFFHQVGLISALFPCFWGFAYLCPPPGGVIFGKSHAHRKIQKYDF